MSVYNVCKITLVGHPQFEFVPIGTEGVITSASADTVTVRFDMFGESAIAVCDPQELTNDPADFEEDFSEEDGEEVWDDVDDVDAEDDEDSY